MTERLYYTDSYCSRFNARVVDSGRLEGGFTAVLDRTAFYPTSGGQPFDTGTLDGKRVIDVVENDEGAIVHLLEAEVARGSEVEGAIDWQRRFDHMQQHTGQHILSAAFDRLFGAATVGFHLGAEVSTIDLAKVLPSSSVKVAEDEANRIVWENRPVSVRFAGEEEASRISFRKEPGRVGKLRIVEVEGFDLSACGGTHVARTGEIGMVAILSSERFRGGVRLEFACGGRALSAYRTFRDSVAGSLRYLSVPPGELPAAIERLQGESKDLRKVLKRMQERLAGFEAASIADAAETVGGRRQVVRAIEGWDQTGLKALASAITANPGYEVALFSTTPPYVAVVACSSDSTADAGAVIRDLTARFGGKGGGKRDLAQGGGFEGKLEDLIAAAGAVLESGSAGSRS